MKFSKIIPVIREVIKKACKFIFLCIVNIYVYLYIRGTHRVFHVNLTGKSNFRDNKLKLQRFHIDNRYGSIREKLDLKERCKRNPKLFTEFFFMQISREGEV